VPGGEELDSVGAEGERLAVGHTELTCGVGQAARALQELEGGSGGDELAVAGSAHGAGHRDEADVLGSACVAPDGSTAEVDSISPRYGGGTATAPGRHELTLARKEVLGN
jgi:hypothetical protein